MYLKWLTFKEIFVFKVFPEFNECAAFVVQSSQVFVFQYFFGLFHVIQTSIPVSGFIS